MNATKFKTDMLTLYLSIYFLHVKWIGKMCYQRTCVVVFCLVSTSAGDVLSIVYPDSSTATHSVVSEKDEG